jgi:hypothetical protein
MRRAYSSHHPLIRPSAQPQIPQSGQVPGSYGPQGMHPGQPPRMTFDSSKGHPVPSSVGNAPAPSGADSQLKAAESGIPEGHFLCIMKGHQFL